MLKINDIKSLEQIPDYSIYIYYFLLFSAVFSVFAILYFLYGYFKKDKNSLEKEYFQILKNIDFKDPKKAAYDISKYGRLLAKNDREKTLINDLYQELEEFKYKKNIDKKMPKKIIAKFETFMESLDVR